MRLFMIDVDSKTIGVEFRYNGNLRKVRTKLVSQLGESDMSFEDLVEMCPELATAISSID